MQAAEAAGGHGADAVGIQTPGEESKKEWKAESRAHYILGTGKQVLYHWCYLGSPPGSFRCLTNMYLKRSFNFISLPGRITELLKAPQTVTVEADSSK